MQQPPFLQNQVVVLLQVQSIENKTALPAFTYKANTWLLSVSRKCNFFLSRSGFNIRYFSDLEKNSWSLPSTEYKISNWKETRYTKCTRESENF